MKPTCHVCGAAQVSIYDYRVGGRTKRAPLCQDHAPPNTDPIVRNNEIDSAIAAGICWCKLRDTHNPGQPGLDVVWCPCWDKERIDYEELLRIEDDIRRRRQ